MTSQVKSSPTLRVEGLRRRADSSDGCVEGPVAASKDMSADEATELIAFLESERADVLEMACEAVAGYTASDEGVAAQLSTAKDFDAQRSQCLAQPSSQTSR